MSLWLVLYVSGKVATSFLMPDSMTYPQCLDMAREQAASATITFDKPPPVSIEMEFRCIWRDDQPLSGDLLQPRSKH